MDPLILTSTRNNTHGDFMDNARVSQFLKKYFRHEDNRRVQRGQKRLTNTQMDSLDMMAAKIGRIFAGDPDFDDHWDDIAGYAHIANHKAGSNEERHDHTNTEAISS